MKLLLVLFSIFLGAAITIGVLFCFRMHSLFPLVMSVGHIAIGFGLCLACFGARSR